MEPERVTRALATGVPHFDRTIPSGAIQTPRLGGKGAVRVETPVSFPLFPTFIVLRSTYLAPDHRQNFNFLFRLR